jgi:hypothetical protein
MMAMSDLLDHPVSHQPTRPVPEILRYGSDVPGVGIAPSWISSPAASI